MYITKETSEIIKQKQLYNNYRCKQISIDEVSVSQNKDNFAKKTI